MCIRDSKRSDSSTRTRIRDCGNRIESNTILGSCDYEIGEDLDLHLPLRFRHIPLTNTPSQTLMELLSFEILLPRHIRLRVVAFRAAQHQIMEFVGSSAA